ncbi:MAG: DUF1579 domain-containing protein [Acidobacteriota bacterium]|nr:DUF1579 domain-containing protein [Acidobacteriota bacterium]
MNAAGRSATPWLRPVAILAALGLVAVVGRPAVGQLAVMERTVGHERLDFLIGEWSHEEIQTILGQERTVRSSGKYSWLPGGVWLRGEATVRGLPGIDVHHGWLQMTYDAAADEYTELWYDNQSPMLFINRGGWTDEKTLVMHGSHEWGGKTIYSQNVYRVVSESEFSREYLVSDDGGGNYVRRSLARYRKRR